MKSERLTDADIRARGWAALVEKLGLTGYASSGVHCRRDHVLDEVEAPEELVVCGETRAHRSAVPCAASLGATCR